MSPRAEARRRPLDARLRATIVAVMVCGAVLTMGGAMASGLGSALSIAIGAALAAANLWALARIIMALLPGNSNESPDLSKAIGTKERAAPAPASPAAWSALAAVKMLALFAVVWLLMRYSVVAPLPMLVGFGALPLGIAIGSLVSDRSAPREP